MPDQLLLVNAAGAPFPDQSEHDPSATWSATSRRTASGLQRANGSVIRLGAFVDEHLPNGVLPGAGHLPAAPVNLPTGFAAMLNPIGPVADDGAMRPDQSSGADKDDSVAGLILQR